MLKLDFHHRWKRTVLRAFSVAAIASLVLATALQAADPEGESSQPTAVTGDDGGQWELGLEGSAGNLTTATAAERYGMQVWLNGWFVTRFNYNEATAWDNDFSRAAVGGSENSYLDSVDLMFYVGHGSPANITFANAFHHDGAMTAANDCYQSWGDNDNEWLALTSCQLLDDTGIGPMANCMNNQHLILGFVSNASAHDNYWDTQAYHFGRYLRYGYSMTQAWFNACDVAQRGRVTRVMAEEVGDFNDNPYYGSVFPDTVNNDYFWYTHSCGTASASDIPLDALQLQELPVIRLAPFSAAQAEDRLNKLGEDFGVPVSPTVETASLDDGTTPPGPNGDTTFVATTTATETIEVDTESGLYHYANLSQLWSGQSAENALALRAASANYIDQLDARRISDAFLNQFGLMPGDAQFYQVVQDSTGTLNKPAPSNDFRVATAQDVEAAEVPANTQVIYSRVITVPAVTAAGITQALTVTVVGPGAKQKVYLPPTGQVSAAGVMQAEPIGVQGGWRAIDTSVRAAAAEPQMVQVIPEAKATALFNTLGFSVALNTLPLEITDHKILSTTLAYYETAPGNSQGELIPVYQFGTDFTLKDGSHTQDLVYVPTSERYLRPLARIEDAPIGLNASVHTLTLTAADATQTLQEAGIGGNQFPFVMGAQGADGTYTYAWYHDTVDPSNKLTDTVTTDGPTKITFKVPDHLDPHAQTLNIILVVTDTDSPNESSSTATAEIPFPTLFLPSLSKVQQQKAQ